MELTPEEIAHKFTHWFGESCSPEMCEVIGNIHQNPELL